MGGHVPAFRRETVPLLHQHSAVGTDQNRSERMVARITRARRHVEGFPEKEGVVEVRQGIGHRDALKVPSNRKDSHNRTLFDAKCDSRCRAQAACRLVRYSSSCESS
jgi:hypothetical protein